MCVRSQIRSFALHLEEGVFTSVMIQIYASAILSLMDDLRKLEDQAKTWHVSNPSNEEVNKQAGPLLIAAVENCSWLQLRSAWKQLHTITNRVKTGKCDNAEFSRLIAELRTRIREDLDDRIFFSVTDPDKIDRFFKPDKNHEGCLMPKRADEIFDAVILERFGDCEDDLVEASKCYITATYTACVFHLMRVVEHGLMEVATLAGITDPKASWGAVLSKVDLYAFRTKHDELPTAIQPHQELLRDLSAEMHSIQYAWRNRVSHIDNKLIPTKPIDRGVAAEIMTTVQAFMRSLAERLPK